jgi:beta-hydroxyacyl-ACP dehydratase FabZ
MAVAAKDKGVVDIQAILKLLPHRFPMLLVDRVSDIVPQKSCRGVKNVTINEAFFAGHFPEKPVMPGVLIVEAMAQAAAVLLLSEPENYGKIPLIGSIKDVRFRKQIVPGDTLETEIVVLWLRNSYGCFRATGTVNGEVAASMEMTFKLIEDGE